MKESIWTKEAQKSIVWKKNPEIVYKVLFVDSK
jgi:hypothetical protein